MKRWAFFLVVGIFGALSFLLWSLVMIKTFLALPETGQKAYVNMIGGYLTVLLLLILIVMRRQRAREFILNPNDRMSNCYHEIKELHFFQKNQSINYWSWTLGSLFLGWTVYLMRIAINHPYALHPATGGIIFFASLLTATIGIEKQRVVDQKLIETTLKGLTIESRLALSDHHYFSNYVKKRRGVWMLFFILTRISPFLLIIFPLYHYSLLPMVGHFLPQNIFWKEGIPLGMIAIVLGFTVVTPFIKLYKKCRMRANVLR